MLTHSLQTPRAVLPACLCFPCLSSCSSQPPCSYHALPAHLVGLGIVLETGAGGKRQQRFYYGHDDDIISCVAIHPLLSVFNPTLFGRMSDSLDFNDALYSARVSAIYLPNLLCYCLYCGDCSLCAMISVL